MPRRQPRVVTKAHPLSNKQVGELRQQLRLEWEEGERRRRAYESAGRNGIRLPEIADGPGVGSSEAITHRHPVEEGNDGRSRKYC